MLSVTGFWLSPQRRPVHCPGPAPWQQAWKGTAEPESRPSSRTQPATTAPCSASLRTTWSPCWCPRPGTGGTTEKTRRPGCKGSSGFLSDIFTLWSFVRNLSVLSSGAAGFRSPTPEWSQMERLAQWSSFEYKSMFTTDSVLNPELQFYTFPLYSGRWLHFLFLFRQPPWEEQQHGKPPGERRHGDHRTRLQHAPPCGRTEQRPGARQTAAPLQHGGARIPSGTHVRTQHTGRDVEQNLAKDVLPVFLRRRKGFVLTGHRFLCT